MNREWWIQDWNLNSSVGIESNEKFTLENYKNSLCLRGGGIIGPEKIAIKIFCLAKRFHFWINSSKFINSQSNVKVGISINNLPLLFVLSIKKEWISGNIPVCQCACALPDRETFLLGILADNACVCVCVCVCARAFCPRAF